MTLSSHFLPTTTVSHNSSHCTCPVEAPSLFPGTKTIECYAASGLSEPLSLVTRTAGTGAAPK